MAYTPSSERLQEAIALRKSGNFQAAEMLLASIDRADPQFPVACYVGCLIAHQQRQYESALEKINAALSYSSGNAAMQYTKGLVLEDLHENEAAIAAYQQAVRLDPGLLQAANNLALLLQAVGRYDDAAKELKKLLSAHPKYATGWNNYGVVLKSLDQLQDAMRSFEKAVELNPRYASAYLNLGISHIFTGAPERADSCFKAALEAGKGDISIQLEVAERFKLLGLYEKALEIVERLLKDLPDHVDGNLLLAELLARLGRANETRNVYSHVLSLNPVNLRARIAFALSLPIIYESQEAMMMARSRYSDELAKLERWLTGAPSFPLEEVMEALNWNNFYLAYQGENDKDLQAGYARIVSSLLAPLQQRIDQEIADPSRGADDAPRIGFASNYFYTCTVGKYFIPWMRYLGKHGFKIYVYNLGYVSDAMTDRVRDCAYKYHHLDGTISSIASRIKKDNLDVLIYPELGMNGKTFSLASLRLAKHQCVAWGHPVTTGYESIDYFISCASMESDDSPRHYSESLYLLPGIGTSYSRPEVPAPASKMDYGIGDDVIVYACPHSLYKILPVNDDLFAEIIARVPNAVIAFFESAVAHVNNIFRERLNTALSRRNLSLDRVIMLKPGSHVRFLSLLQSFDIMLDPVNWSGGNTSLDALACGVPIVTLEGKQFRSRQTAGMYKQMAIDGLTAFSHADYVDISSRLGVDGELRNGFRHAITASSPALFDADKPLASLAGWLHGLARTNAPRGIQG